MPAMNKSSSIPAASTAAPKENIARSYLQVKRLRQLVQEAERLRVSHVKPEGCGINPKRRRQSSIGSLTARRWDVRNFWFAANYFVALAIVMTGWLWLIAWVAMQLI
jgi:hypothetical protein